MTLGLTDDKSTLVQVMAWCRQATSHYLSQCWPCSMLPYGVTRPQWVKYTRYQSPSCVWTLHISNHSNISLGTMSRWRYLYTSGCHRLQCNIGRESLGNCPSIKMPDYQYGNLHDEDKVVSWPSYLYHGNPHTWKDAYGLNSIFNILKWGPGFVATWLISPTPSHCLPSRATWWRVCVLTAASWSRPTPASSSIKISCTTTTGTMSSWTKDTRYATPMLRSPLHPRQWVMALHGGIQWRNLIVWSFIHNDRHTIQIVLQFSSKIFLAEFVLYAKVFIHMVRPDHHSLQNKCRTADIDRQNLGRSGKLSFFIIHKCI